MECTVDFEKESSVLKFLKKKKKRMVGKARIPSVVASPSLGRL